MRIPELLAPVGGGSQLIAAVRFGADAVYLGLNQYGMRAHAGNFTSETLKDAVEYAHAHNVLVYLTLNIFAYDEDIEPMVEAARTAKRLGVDAVIMADPGAAMAVIESVPGLSVHLSTQMSTMNARSAALWHRLGVPRIVLARELSLEQIENMRRQLPDTLELESFVHGAVCMSFSGRCALSKYLTGRDANRGDCAQACRWRYQLVEEKRPGQYFPVETSERGTQIFAAGDMNMLPHLDKLVASGLSSLKIEGRMKNEYYIATVVGAYRRGLDAIREGRWTDELRSELIDELNKVSHRAYDTGFYFGAPERPGGNEGNTQTMELTARVLSYENGRAKIHLKNKVILGDRLELMTPSGVHSFELADLTSESGEQLTQCGVPNSILWMGVPAPAEEGDLLRGPCRNHTFGV